MVRKALASVLPSWESEPEVETYSVQPGACAAGCAAPACGLPNSMAEEGEGPWPDRSGKLGRCATRESGRMPMPGAAPWPGVGATSSGPRMQIAVSRRVLFIRSHLAPMEVGAWAG